MHWNSGFTTRRFSGKLTRSEGGYVTEDGLFTVWCNRDRRAPGDALCWYIDHRDHDEPVGDPAGFPSKRAAAAWLKGQYEKRPACFFGQAARPAE